MVVIIATKVKTLAARFATKAHPTPNSDEKSPAAPNPNAKPVCRTMLKSFSMTNFFALPCSRSREKGMHAPTSNSMIAATRTTYDGFRA